MVVAMFIDGGVGAGFTPEAVSLIINYSSLDLMWLALHIVGVSSLLGFINSIVTFHLLL